MNAMILAATALMGLPVTEIDVVTVFHSDELAREADVLRRSLRMMEQDRVNLIFMDNRPSKHHKNVGFAKACNDGAELGRAPIIGFLNPDTRIEGPFVATVKRRLENPRVVITGERYDKPRQDLAVWGCRDWVCGATMFVQRKWWERVGGFDEGYVWSWEETDLIRLAQSQGLVTRSVKLPLHHESPDPDSDPDREYKTMWFARGRERFNEKWGQRQ